MPVDMPRLTPSCKPERGAKKGPKIRLITRASLDRRTRALRVFESIAGGITNDLGGRENLTTVLAELVEAFAGAAVNMRDLNSRLLVGEEIDLAEQAAAISSLVRLATRIGVDRVPHDVTPTLADIAAEIDAAKQHDEEERVA